jgi:hypothetical protein
VALGLLDGQEGGQRQLFAHAQVERLAGEANARRAEQIAGEIDRVHVALPDLVSESRPANDLQTIH